MLNYNSPNAFRGHMRKPVPVGAQAVRMVLPDDARIKSATLLWVGKPVAFKQTGRVIELTVPKIEMYEVVALQI